MVKKLWDGVGAVAGGVGDAVRQWPLEPATGTIEDWVEVGAICGHSLSGKKPLHNYA
ncbi:hypothetical protein PHLCEN_2v779 [Hermanssonia centrifuga]|uniref:Uncharacterized protein n=1 Tax=Hermanssonia centrifuga TaxID=98765 RepID=A0A2R6S507_9APHY|nr:hypothetical protein PHLCEN_2v779 [Hermanssonia centrifuga]